MKAEIKSFRVGPVLKSLMVKDFVLDPVSLAKVGRILVEAVKDEAKKDFAKRGKSPYGSGPEGLPDSHGKTIRPSFFESFSVRISGNRTLTIVSTWPWIDSLVEGRPAGPMKQFTRDKHPKPIRFLKKDGTVLYRMAPKIGTFIQSGPNKGKAATFWMHPGYARHTFVDRGIAKGRKKLLDDGILFEIMIEQIKRTG